MLSRRRTGSRGTSRPPGARRAPDRGPLPGSGTGHRCGVPRGRRRNGDFAIVGLAVSLTLADGGVADARLAFAGGRTAGPGGGGGGSPGRREAVGRAVGDGGPRGDRRPRPARRPQRVAGVPAAGGPRVRRGLQAAADDAYERQWTEIEVTVPVNGGTRNGSVEAGRRWRTSSAMTSISPGPTSGASTGSAARAPSSSTAGPCARA